MTLPADYARCHDDACPDRERCLRWLGRDDEHPRLVHVATLNPVGAVLCPQLITSDCRKCPNESCERGVCDG